MSNSREDLSASTIRSRMKRDLDPNAAFPTMLHRMLSDIDEMSKGDDKCSKLNTIVGWLEDGRAFRIHDKNKFISIVMPIWFIRLKYASFIRQLNAYNFGRINDDGPDKGAIYHSKFLRDMPELAAQIEKGQKRGSDKRAKIPRVLSPQSAMQQQQQQPIMGFPTAAYGSMGQLPTNTSFGQLKQFQPRAVSEGSLKSMMFPHGQRPHGYASLQQPMEHSFMHNSVFQPIPTEPTHIPHHLNDPFGGLTWTDPDQEDHLGHMIMKEEKVIDAPVEAFGHPYDEYPNNSSLDFEPVPITPHVDMQQNQAYSQCLSNQQANQQQWCTFSLQHY